MASDRRIAANRLNPKRATLASVPDRWLAAALTSDRVARELCESID